MLASSVSDQQIYSPRRKDIAQCGASPDAIHAVDFNDQNDFPIETPQGREYSFGLLAELYSNISEVG